jgi:hypothetical protein
MTNLVFKFLFIFLILPKIFSLTPTSPSQLWLGLLSQLLVRGDSLWKALTQSLHPSGEEW